MLYIKYKTNDEFISYLDWHIGEPFPDLEAENILKLQFDGDELEWAKPRYTLTPVSRGAHVQSVEGSDASYIWEQMQAELRKKK